MSLASFSHTSHGYDVIGNSSSSTDDDSPFLGFNLDPKDFLEIVDCHWTRYNIM